MNRRTVSHEKENMDQRFDLLARTIRSISRNGPVYYMPNPGNWGDALIREGTLMFLRDAGIAFTELPVSPHLSWRQRWRKNGTLLYGGGGGWCSLWRHSIEILRKYGPRFEHTLVLPSTYESSFYLPSTSFFCRDRYQSQDNMPDALFCPDMAFYLGRLAVPPGCGMGHFFRTDPESSHRFPLPSGNRDISASGTHLTPTDALLEQLARYESIATDRLHVGIAACLLGRELHLFPGSYFKNKAVYLSSIQGHFDNVHFHDPGDPDQGLLRLAPRAANNPIPMELH